MDVICAEEGWCRGLASLMLVAVVVVVAGKWHYFFCCLPVAYDLRPGKTVGVAVDLGPAQLDSTVAWVVAVLEETAGISRRA